MTLLTGFIQVLFFERNSSPSVLWWWALAAPAGWTLSETSVVGWRRGMIRGKYCFRTILQVRWTCQLWQMYPKTRMRRKSFYQPYLLTRLTISPNIKMVIPSWSGKEHLRLTWTLLNYIFDNSVHLDIKRIKYGCE